MNPLEILRDRCDKAATQIGLAHELGVSPQYLNDVLAERREPGPKILEALGLERVVSYRRRKKENGELRGKV